MLDATLSSSLGRCPTCGQMVTLPAEASEQQVACPKCRYRAPGTAFSAVEAPLPVVLLAGPDDGMTPATFPDDNERTHLLLDLPCDEETGDDAQTLAPVRSGSRRAAPAPPSRRPRREDPEDRERTHLLLGAADVQEEPDAPLAAAAAASARVHPAADEAERTRLALGPLSVRAEPRTTAGRVVARLGRWVPPLLRCSVWLDEGLHGRWSWALGAFALACGVVAPMIDSLSSGTTLGAVTWLTTLLGLGAIGLSQLNGLRTDADRWDPRVLVFRIRTGWSLLFESFERWGRSPPHLQLSLAGRALAGVGLASFCWVGFLSATALLFGFSRSQSLLPFLSCVLLFAGVLLELRARQLTPAPAVFLQDFGNAVAAAATLPPIVDLEEPLPEPFAQGNTALHESVQALTQWLPRAWPDEAAYKIALERHLQRRLHGARIERDHWMGATRLDGVIDLLVNRMVVIAVQRGFDTGSAERAIGQVTRYARAWSGKPILLVLFDTPREALLESANARALRQARERFSLLTLRMPTP